MSAAPIRRRPRHPLPLAASTLALATALAGPVYGQATTPNSYVSPAPTLISGGVTADYNTPNTDIYTVSTPTAVLNFTPSDNAVGGGANNPINFQNANTDVFYRSAPGGPNFTILNRIVPADPTRPVAFNGRVTSQLVDGAGNMATGGSVWFYSPGGIILGDGSAFNVGSLLLTTADPTGSLGSNTFNLTSTNPNGVVSVLSQATITAINENSYVALVAPKVFTRGTINVNGAAAFVAAENATLTFNQGLFDINVTTGADADGFPIELRGTIRLDKSGTATNQRGIYAVAVPKNSAVSMIIAPDGYFGFDVAQGATISNGGVYLVAGGNLSINPPALTPGKINALPTVAGGNISIEGSAITPPPAGSGLFNAPVAARASGTIDVANFSTFANQSSPIAFASDLAIFGGTSSTLSATAGTIAIGGDLDIQSFGLSGNLGTALLSAGAGGTVNVTGSTLVRASLPNGMSYTQGLYDFSTGGTARIDVNGGTVQVGGRISVEADGRGENGQVTQGGTTAVTVNNGTLGSNTSINIYAGAVSANGTATGGMATLDVANGTVQTDGFLIVGAGGFGGPASNGVGGTARVTVAQGGVINATSQVQIDTSSSGGTGAAGSAGGTATGGTSELIVQPTAGPATGVSSGDFYVFSSANGGLGAAGGLSSGGAATAGTASVTIGTGSTLTSTRTAILSASATGGSAAGASSAGGDASGGNATFSSTGIVDVAVLSLNADATGGDKTGGTGNAGNAASGLSRVFVTAGSVTATRDPGTQAFVPGIAASAVAQGGAVTGGTGAGGSGTSGGATLGGGGARISIVTDATVSSGRLATFANGTGGAALGAGFAGGDGTAGTSSIFLSTNGALQIGTATVRSNAIGGAAPGGTGGTATSNLAELISAPSSGALAATAFSGPVVMSANATGGSGLTGGNATASLVSLRATGSAQPTTIGGAVTLSSLATGGNGQNGNGGDVTGSSIRVEAERNLSLADALTATADANAGFASGTATNGGQATAGSISLLASTGNLSVAGVPTLSASALSGSSNSGAAGTATGGAIGLTAYAGSLTLGSAGQISATATGGVSSGDGGSATGGTVGITTEVDPDSGASGGTITTAGLQVNLNALASQLQNQGRIGGAATGGNFALVANTGAITMGDLGVGGSANGYGGSDPSTTTMQGGTALIEAKGADVTIASALVYEVGGAATVFNSNPPAGPGAAIGGAIMLSAAAGRTLTITNSFIGAADAISGRSSLPVQAGSGTGGQILVDATGTIRATGGLSLSASGQGGNVFGLSSATAGSGIGGSIDIAVTGLLDAAGGIGATASGRGGDPLSAGNAVAGSGTGGVVRLSAFQSGVIQTGDISIGTSGSSNGGATIAGSSTFTVNAGNATVGAYIVANAGAAPSATVSSLGATGGRISAASINIQATGDYALTTGAGGSLRIGTGLVQATGTLTFGDGTTVSTVPGDIAVANDLTVIVGGDYIVGGAFGAGGTYSVSSDGRIATAAANGGTGVAFAAAGPITTGAVTSASGSIALVARTGSLATGALQADRSVVLLAPQSISTGAITTGTNAGDVAFLSNLSAAQSSPLADLVSQSGPLNSIFDYRSLATATPQRLAGTATIGGAVRTGALRVAAAGGVTSGAIIANSVLIDSGTTITTGDVTTPSALTLQADGAVTTGALTSGGDILAVSRTAQLTTGNVQAGGNAALLAKTAITTGAISARRTNGGYILLADAANAGAIDINAAGTAIAGPVSVGGPVSAAILRTTTSGTASFGGAIDVAQFARLTAADISLSGATTGPDLAFSSANLRLGANGSIGNAATQTVAFTATGTGPSFLGGTGDGNGYTLDASELSRVRAASISFNGGPALTVRDATVSGTGAGASANITGANGALTLTSSGTISITGNLRFNDAGAGQSLILNAGAVRLFSDTGSIGVFAGTALGGRLAIGANRIEAGTAQLLNGTTSFAGPLSATTTAAIGTAASQPRAEGVIQANRIELAATNDIIIQNTGSAALAAGFTAGAGGLAITSRGGTQTTSGFNVLVYGRIQNAAGFATNNDTLPVVSFASGQASGTAGYSTQSVVNGCPIIGGCLVTPPPPPPTNVITPPPVAALVRDVIDGTLITFSRDTVFLPSFNEPVTIDLSLLNNPAIVTDPVASAGNPILWESMTTLQKTARSGPATGKKQIDEEGRKRESDREKAR